MRQVVDPRQNRLSNPHGTVLTEATRRCLPEGWPGVFRHVILELRPRDVLGGHLSPKVGPPTRELYSMAGLVLLMESAGPAPSARALTHGASREKRPSGPFFVVSPIRIRHNSPPPTPVRATWQS